MFRKVYKYRLYPNEMQKQKLQWILDRCRELYNAGLQERRDMYAVFKRHPNFYDAEWRKQAVRERAIDYYDQSNQLPEIKELREEYKDIYGQVLQNVLCRVDRTFKAFFLRVQRGEKTGHPRFKGQNQYDSFTYPQVGRIQGHQKGPSFDGSNRILFPRIGTIKVKLHRSVEGKIKTATIKREGEHWYVIFVCEVTQIVPLPVSYEDVGIDLGISHFAALSNGEFIDNPRYYRKAEKRLQKHQQSLDRKKQGSHRWGKAKKLVAKAHRKVRNQRRDFLHKQSHRLVQTYQVIAFENLQTANMVKRPKPKQDEVTGQYLPNGAVAKTGLNKSIGDAGWATFVRYCEIKAESAGRAVVKVNPKYTSQICSACHEKGPHKDLAERTHICVHCGVVLDRDTNAAINILRLGQSLQTCV